MENTFQFPTEYRNDHEWPFAITNLDNMCTWCQKSDFSSLSGRSFSSNSTAHKNDIPMIVYVFCNTFCATSRRWLLLFIRLIIYFYFTIVKNIKVASDFVYDPPLCHFPLHIKTISLQFFFCFRLISSSYGCDLIRVMKSHTRNETRLFASKTKNACFFRFVSYFHN